MGRVVEGPAPGQMTEYIPDVKIGDWDNRTDPDPVTVWVTNPTRAGVRKVRASSKPQRVEMDAKGNVISMDIDEYEQEERMKRTLEAFVEKVENYKANGVDIADGKTLWEHGESSFVYDVSTHIMGLLDIPKKTHPTSSERSGSSPAETDLSNGTAANVA